MAATSRGRAPASRVEGRPRRPAARPSPGARAPARGRPARSRGCPGTITTGLPAQAVAQIRQERLGQLEHRPRGGLAQLQQVAEQHHAVGLCERARAAAPRTSGRRAMSAPDMVPRCRSDTIAVSTGRILTGPIFMRSLVRSSAATTASPPTARSARRARCSRARSATAHPGEAGQAAEAERRDEGPRVQRPARRRGPVRARRRPLPGAPGEGAGRGAAGRVGGLAAAPARPGARGRRPAGPGRRAPRACCRSAMPPRCIDALRGRAATA